MTMDERGRILDKVAAIGIGGDDGSRVVGAVCVGGGVDDVLLDVFDGIGDEDEDDVDTSGCDN